MRQALHQPVMLKEVVDFLKPRPGGRYVDLTLGFGGHARRVLEESAPDGQLLGVDRDPQVICHAARNLASFGNRLRLVQGKFSELPRFLEEAGWREVDGLLADLGASSLQLDDASRGFSFGKPGPLDMRMDPTQGVPLGDFLARMDVDALADILRRLGEVSPARLIARRIVSAQRAGKLADTVQLARIAGEKGRSRSRVGDIPRIHPATRVFLALRIAINDELQELQAILDRLPDPLKVGGRGVFISFHSLEDRRVKKRLADLAGRCTCPPGLPQCQCGSRLVMRSLTRRPIRPSMQETIDNPRSRSARLRATERVAA